MFKKFKQKVEDAADQARNMMGAVDENPTVGASTGNGSEAPNDASDSESVHNWSSRSPLPSSTRDGNESDASVAASENSFLSSPAQADNAAERVAVLERRCLRFKTKYAELYSLYQEASQERQRLKTTLTETQDKLLRRISELQEQIELDQAAKRDLEQNYQGIIDERIEENKVLQTQIKLLKDTSQNVNSTSETDETAKAEENSVLQLREKVARLESLLGKCRENIKLNKEKVAQLSEENAALKKMGNDCGNDLNTQHSKIITALQTIVGNFQTGAGHDDDENADDNGGTVPDFDVQLDQLCRQISEHVESLRSRAASSEAAKESEELARLRSEAERKSAEIDELQHDIDQLTCSKSALTSSVYELLQQLAAVVKTESSSALSPDHDDFPTASNSLLNSVEELSVKVENGERRLEESRQELSASSATVRMKALLWKNVQNWIVVVFHVV